MCFCLYTRLHFIVKIKIPEIYVCAGPHLWMLDAYVIVYLNHSGSQLPVCIYMGPHLWVI